MKIKIRLKHLKIQKCLGKEIDNQIFKSVNHLYESAISGRRIQTEL